MDVEDGQGRPPMEGWRKSPKGEEKPPKRKMKSPYQLEILEGTYAAEMYPSETLRAELSVKTGLSDRQLQMWFCHRRLKDRKHAQGKRGKKEEEPLTLPAPPVIEMKAAPRSSSLVPSSVPFSGDGGETRKAVARIGPEVLSEKRYYELPFFPPQPPQLSMLELRIIASVEAQLGESLREDGPILGFEFDPLPPGAFGEPIESDMRTHSTYGRASFQFLDRPESSGLSLQGKQLVRPYDAKSVKTSEVFPGMDHSIFPSSSGQKRKAPFSEAHAVHSQMPPRALQEYQFLPEQPSRSDLYERVPQSHFYDSPVATPSSRVPSFPTGSQYVHGNDQMTPTYTFQGQVSSSVHLPQPAREHFHANAHDGASNVSPFGNSAADSQIVIHPAMGLEHTFLSPEGRIIQDDLNKAERKLKSEARIAKEVEAHEKKIRRELEKQDVLRRKREEQMRREMDRVDNERRKEEERMLREKQREEERFLREQKRENERKEKILLKESLRAEKLRQKEEKQREKEAARIKAANERATARRISREYMELIEDERLELMELAALSKGLPSVISLDNDTLAQLEPFRDQLNAFPPKSVKLKRPFNFQPWIQSEENVGKLLMVWKFLITFIDALGLWSFTLDEFLQALHDYDSRLLGEIHVALLKIIIRDIEDVARTPANALRANHTTANPSGGHSQIVEGAYAWGFSISSWQRHLNYLTWPEILRQFALSAGFGPQLKKRHVERTYFRDDNEVDDREDIVSTLRNGAAAETAAALMQTKSYNHRRGCRHRLTPGTVKFAAFHVLSLEGSKGLTILEVAEKIQKSGLRDLTTSKTPEASIAAALSRDADLFERIAPSTYCVRPAFRKNPADAEAVLAAARKKMPVFQSGFSDSEVEKDAEDADNGERDEDSEWDDFDVQDCSVETKSNMHVPNSNKFKGFMVDNLVNNGKKEVLCDTSVLTSQSSRDVNNGFQIDAAVHSNQGIISSAAPSGKIGSNYIVERKNDVEDVEIDESNFGELWVQGLTEGDYTDLSVEERLNALVALTGVAIEGNSIRGILEERLEAATALKKQMWAEVQLDKRRYKEDYLNKSQSTALSAFESEAVQPIVGAHGYQTPLQLPHAKSSDDNSEVVSNDKFPIVHNLNNIDVAPSERIILGQELSANPESCSLQQYGIATEKSRFQLKSYIGHKAEQLYVYRSLPLGEDRRKNKYWLFSTSASPNDPGSGRIFFESRDGFWRLIDSIETFDTLLASLDTRGVRESHLHSMLQGIETNFKEAVRRNKKCSTSSNTSEFPFKRGVVELISTPDFLSKYESLSSPLCGLTSNTTEYSTSFSVDLGQSEAERTAALNRYRGFVKWMWKECCNPHILCARRYGKRRSSELLQTCQICYRSYFTEERHCTSCHGTFKSIYNGDAMFTKHIAACALKRKASIDSENQMPDSSLHVGACLLKTQLSLIEASIPPEALQPFWTEGYRKSWGVKLNLASSPDEFLQLLTLLEGAVKQGHLSSKFETTTELLTSAKANNALILGSVPVLPWIPDATAAVSLRLLELDASISYVSLPKLEPQKERDSEDFMKLSPRFMIVKAGTSEQIDSHMAHAEGRSLVPGSRFRGRGRGSSRGFGRRGRGRRGRGRGGRRSRESGLVREEMEEDFFDKSENTPRKYGRRGRVRGRGGRFGQRSVRFHESSESHTVAPRATFYAGSDDVGVHNKEDSAEESSRSSGGGDDWGIEARSYMKEDIGFGSNSEGHGRASRDEYVDQLPKYARRCNEAESMGAMEDDSEDEADEGTEEEEEEDDDDDDGEVAFDDVDATVNDQDEETDVDEDMVDDDDDEIGADELSDGEEGYGDEDDEGSYSSSE